MFFDKVNFVQTENELKISYSLRCFSTWGNFIWSIVALIPIIVSIFLFSKLINTLTNFQDISSVSSALFQFMIAFLFGYGGIVFCFQRRGMIITKEELVYYESTIWIVTIRYAHTAHGAIQQLTQEDIPDSEGWEITRFYLYYSNEKKEVTRDEAQAISQMMNIPITTIANTKL